MTTFLHDYHLTPQQQRKWKSSLERLFRKEAERDVEIVIDLLEQSGESGSEKKEQNLKSELSRFKSGHQVILKSWFTKNRAKRLAPLAEVLEIEDNIFDKLLLEAAGDEAGEGLPELWHPAFPKLGGQGPVVPVKLRRGREVKNLAELADIWVEQAQKRQGGEAAQANVWLWVVGDAGSGRTTAARLLHDAIAELLEKAEAPAPDVNSEGVAPAESSQLPTPSPPKLLLSEPTGGWEKARKGAEPRAIAVVEKKPSDLPNQDWVLEPVPWDVDAFEHLVRSLHDLSALSPPQHERCQEFLTNWRRAPDIVDGPLYPDTAIQLVSDLAHRKVPASPSELRQVRTGAAWARATRAAPKRLGVLGADGERLMARFYAYAFLREGQAGLRSQSLEDAYSTLSLASEAEALAPRCAEETGDLVEQLAKARGDNRQKLAARIRAQLATSSGMALVGALEEGLLLRVDREVERVESPSLELSRYWAARGLDLPGVLTKASGWDWLADAGWLALVRELAILAFGFDDLVDVLDEAPAWLAIERARSLVVLAGMLPDDGSVPHNTPALVSAWGTALYSLVTGGLEPSALHVPDRWKPGGEGFLLVTALQNVSHRFPSLLPRLDIRDLPGSLRAHVQRDVLVRLDEFGEAGDATTDEERAGRKESHEVWLGGHGTFARGDRRAQAGAIIRLAPYQCVPTTTEEIELGRDAWRKGQNILARPCVPADDWPWPSIEVSAETGDERAKEILTGKRVRWRADAPSDLTFSMHSMQFVERDEEFDLWNTVPWQLRLKWFGHEGTDEYSWALLHLIDPQKRILEAQGVDSEGLTLLHHALKRLPREEVSTWLGEMACLDHGQPENEFGVWLRRVLLLAEKLRLDRPLLRLVGLPQEWLASLRFRRVGDQPVLDLQTESERLPLYLRWPRQTADSNVQPEWAKLELLIELAVDAAAALHRIGHPGPLRNLWTNPSPWEIPKRLMADHELSLLIQQMRHTSLKKLEDSEIPQAEFEEFVARWLAATRDPEQHALLSRAFSARDAERLMEGFGDIDLMRVPEASKLVTLSEQPITAWREAAQRTGPPGERTKLILKALLGLWLLPPVEVSDEITAWLRHLEQDQVRSSNDIAKSQAENKQTATSRRALAALLELRDEEVLRWWMERDKEFPDERTHDWIESIREALRTDDDTLDAVWRMRPKGPALDELVYLAWRDDFQPRAGSQGEERTAEPGPKVDWWVEAALRLDPMAMFSTALLRIHHPAVVPLLRRLHAETADERTKLLWAAALHQHEPWCSELTDGLRRWACDDEEPFSGGESFWVLTTTSKAGSSAEPRYRIESLEISIVVGGGYRALLALLGEYSQRGDEQWIADAAVRLWSLMLEAMPDKSGGWEQQPYDFAEGENRPFEPFGRSHKYKHDSLPEPTASLFDLMWALGHKERLEKDLWPSTDKPTYSASPEDASDSFHLRELQTLWLGRADTSALRQMVHHGRRGWKTAALLLAERGDAKFADSVRSWLAGTATLPNGLTLQDALYLVIDFLELLTPEKVADHLIDLFNRLPACRQDILWEAARLGEMHYPGSAKLRAFVRRQRWESTPKSKEQQSRP